MREIGVGIRIDLNEGLSFTGIERVNALINMGGKVTSIEPGGAVMRKLGDDGEDGDDVRLTLSGCEMKVIVDDSGIDSSPQMLEHNRLFETGSELISPYMHLTNKQPESAGTEQAQERLRQGISLLKDAIAINPANWSAYWIVGKAYQSLGDAEQACEAFGKSFGLQKANADVAREYMFECLNLGKTDRAIVAARRAVTVAPEDPGLIANLALALLIGGKLDEAAGAIEKSLAMAPEDQISFNLKQMIGDVQAGRRPQPAKLADLDAH